MPLDPSRRFPVMAITQDGLPLDHIEQARRLCAAGARWIQLRMKAAPAREIADAAARVVPICRAAGAVCIVNDHIEAARFSGADGAHLGQGDLEWREARELLGPGRILGGTVNHAAAASRAVQAACLDYVGVGPLRFTSTKQALAPVLGWAGVKSLLALLGDLPAWIIGGVRPEDLPDLLALGAAGVAVSGALFRDGLIEANLRTFLSEAGTTLSPSSSA